MTRSNFREKGFILAYSLRGYSNEEIQLITQSSNKVLFCSRNSGEKYLPTWKCVSLMGVMAGYALVTPGNYLSGSQTPSCPSLSFHYKSSMGP